MSEKTEKATPYKLRKNQEQGKVSKSLDINTSVSLFVIVAIAIALWPSVIVELKTWMTRLLLLSPHFMFSVNSIMSLQDKLLSQLISLWSPLALATIITIVICTVAQTGFVFSFTPIKPDMKRLNPIAGFKRLFSIKMLFDTGKNVLKFTLACLLLSLNLKYQLPFYLHLMALSPTHALPFFLSILASLLLQLIMLLFLIAVIDKGYTRWKFAKDNRMSKQEIKDEYRQREGDPKIKLKIKQLHQLQRLKASSFEHIKTADVVITNPTHIAVVLKYDRGRMPAPKVVYKVRGEAVQQVKQLAVRYHIPIIEHKILARMLFSASEINQSIKREHFPMVAQIYKTIYQQKATTAC